MESSYGNLDSQLRAKLEQAEIDAAVKQMKKFDWKFLGLMTAPFLFVAGVLLAVAYAY